ncbi:hypothetical protein DFP72DRAFT_1175067 [Ephemerocybe angulata]|uniref:Ribonuclease H1 N-terminal domain-containing protein n=1 Tax=Ephemerocybe angulata TaxID=980116 RepID=A0A8H6HHN0_9AGAR|nr:hypothetical protein DFP72DRAFT_1175067 [Tulosesus angulatus]
MTDGSSSQSNTSPSSLPPAPSSLPPAPTSFSLPDLVEALGNFGYVIVSPKEQMEREEAIADVAAAEVFEAPANGAAPVGSSPEAMPILTASATGTIDPSAVPDIHIDNIIAALNALRVSRAAGEQDQDSDKTGKEKENPASTTDNAGFVCARCGATLACTRCNTQTATRPSPGIWYCVTVGSEVGVFNGWHLVQPLVSGVSGACYKRHKSESDAHAAFDAALERGHVHTVAP